MGYIPYVYSKATQGRRFFTILIVSLVIVLSVIFCASNLLAQTCPYTTTLREETCLPGISPCTTKGSTLTYEELDRDLLNTHHLCNGPGLYTWPSPGVGFLLSDALGTLSFTSASGVGSCPGGQFVSAVNNNAAPTCGTPAGGGSSVILDLADNGSNESSAITEIATTGDTNSIFTEPSADKLLIAVGNAWPLATLASTATALSANPANCSAGQYPLGIAASGAVESCTVDDDTPDTDAEVPNNISLVSGFIGNNTLQGTVKTSGLTSEPGQANLGLTPRWLGVADGSAGAPISDTQPTSVIQRWDANGSGSTSIGVQTYCNHTTGSGFHYCDDTFGRNNGRNTNDFTGKNGRVIMEPFGLVQSPAATPSTTGGTLATNTYAYYIDAEVSGERILGSQHVTAAVTGPTGSVSLTWTALSGATGYRVYRYIPSTPSTPVVWFAAATNSFTDTGAAGTAGIGLPSTGWGVWAQCTTGAHSARCAGLESGVVNSSGQHAPYLPNVVGSTFGIQVPSAGAHNNSIGVHVTSGGSSFRRGLVLDGSSFSEIGIDLSDSPASLPGLRLANTQDLVSRNAANTGDVSILEVDSSNLLRLGGGTATIDPTNQRLGIVTTSPDERLEIEESANSSTIGLVQNTSTGSSAIAIWRSESDGAIVSMNAHGSGRVATRFGVTVANYGELLQTTGNGLLVGTSTSAPLIFGTASAQRMTINADGSIDIPQMSVPSNPSSGTRRLFVNSSTGELSVRTSAGVTTSLEATGGSPGALPRVSVRLTADQSIGTGADTAIAFNSEVVDQGGMHDNVTNNTRMTVQSGEDGTYLADCGILVQQGTNERIIRIRKNGTTIVAEDKDGGISNTGINMGMSVSTVLELVATDYIECIAFHAHGSNISVRTDERTHGSLTKLR